MNENLPDDPKHPLVGFLRRAGADRPCPACATNDWTIIQGDQQTPGIPIFSEEADLATVAPHYPVVLLMCAHCGFLREHFKAFVDDEIARHTNGK
jgi:hypothetical protein